MTSPVQVRLITPLAADPASLVAAEADFATLADYDTWWSGNDLSLLRRLGENLFRLAFGDAKAVQDLLGTVGHGPLRLGIATTDARLARLPWEYLCVPEAVLGAVGRTAEALGWPTDGLSFLALHPQVSLVRCGTRVLESAPIRVLDGPLRLLVVSANPACGHWPDANMELDAEAIVARLRGVSTSHIDVEVLPHASASALEARLTAFRPHLVHFTGHGAFPALDDPGDLDTPALVLNPEPGAGCHAYLTAQTLGGLCEHHGVRALVLNSPWSGHGYQSRAAVLVDAGVPMVVAMQMPPLISSAAGIAGAIYLGLTFGRSLEDCLQEYRQGCLRTQMGPEVPDWGVPVLYLGVEDSHPFRVADVDPYPIDVRPLLGRHVPIVGRGFLFEHIATWRSTGQGGVFLLTAAPGVGKTAFAAQWVYDHPAGAHYFFIHSDRQGERSEAGRPPVGVGRGRAAAVVKGPEVPKPRRPYASASDMPSSHSRRGHGEARQRAAGRVPCRCRDPGAGRTGA